MRRLLHLMCCLLLCACGKPAPFPTQSETEAHLRAHMESFERAAQAFPKGTVFCRFSESSFRWEDSFIERVDGAYEVLSPSGARTVAGSLREAAAALGAPDDALTHWAEVCKSLRVYCINRYKPYVEILLEGSEWTPYGLRCAPASEPDVYDLLNQEKVSELDIVNRHISGRWWYFESKH